VTQSVSLAVMIGSGVRESESTTARSPKTAELIAHTLRRLIAEGQLKDGDFLPTEAELISQFAVSRASLREAVLLLESERLVEVRRGSRSGARVRMPGSEIVARPASLLLQAAGATIADVMVARCRIEPAAAKLLAQEGTPQAFDELESILGDEFPVAWKSGRLAEVAAKFHRRLVELTGNATLSIIAGMLHTISEQHTVEVLRRRRKISAAQYQVLLRSYHRLIELVRSGDADQAEAHWRHHMDMTCELLPNGVARVRIRDVTS
jgi:GntR family transcriptional regulator, transcriptional repressor for pyruvate dehydrogenase complex